MSYYCVIFVFCEVNSSKEISLLREKCCDPLPKNCLVGDIQFERNKHSSPIPAPFLYLLP